MKKHLCCFVAALVGLLAASALPVHAQTDNEWTNPGVGDYNAGANWSLGSVPWTVLGEVAVINNGGTAFVQDDILDPAGGVVLGRAAGDSGTLEIRSGGSLSVLADTGAMTTGIVTVGQAGQGHLIVHRGGTLTSDGLTSGGAAASSITLGQTTGAGMATVTIDGTANLNRNTRVIGPNVSFTADSLTLGSQHNLIGEITGTTHSPLGSTGSATLGGNLTLDFNGHTPSAGNTWTLIDASSISGSFASITSDTPITEPGFGFFLQTVPGGMNGRIAQLSIEARLLLSINRTSGEAALSNLTTGEDFDIDGYLITSPSGSLDPGGWTSFEGAGQANWQESNAAEKHVGELNLLGSRVLGGGAEVGLGDIYAPSQFGTPDDLTFQYHLAGGDTVTGLIEYTGMNNNLVLVVDPDTGEAALQNQSTFDIDIDGYLITSASNALNPDGLSGLGAGWTPSNLATNHIGELNLQGAAMLGGRSGALPLGMVFDLDNPMAEQDLTFEFHLEGTGGEMMTGIVQYGELPDEPPDLLGDYSGNGLVEQADLDLVLSNWGANAQDVPATWIKDPPEGFVDQAELDKVLTNWGSQGGLAAAAAVPEPASALLLLAAAAFAAFLRVRR